MKKKGFTLIELLAVIVVLAVIALITVPTILGVIEKARRSSLQDSGYGLVEAANLYYAQYQNNKTVRFDIENNKMTTEEENELKYKGNVKKGTVLINNKGKATVCINDGKHAAYKNYQDTKVTIVDSKTCTVPENDYIVYLDGEKTIKEMNNQELTDAMELVNKKLEQLEIENVSLKSQVKALEEKEELTIDRIYPIGSIYISIDNTNPSELFGGTWETYASGKTLVGVDSSNTKYNSSNKTGGSSTASLSIENIPSHTHSIPALSGTAYSSGVHTHDFSTGGTALVVNSSTSYSGMPNNLGFSASQDTWWSGGNKNIALISSSGAHTHNIVTNVSITGAIGSGTSFSVQNPYVTVYMWKRVK